jgi:TPP-dependent pyruvate/acetoin dehydrogenase alpha subunit
VLCYLGDGATSEGDFHEGLNLAGVYKVPAVFVIQNNQWAISVPRNKQTASTTLAQKASSYGFPGILVDGNDVLAMYLATREALEHARSGKGPVLIEAFTYRMWMHTTADDPSKYRSHDEEIEWERKDPIKRMRIYLREKGIWSQEWEDSLSEEAQRIIKAEVEIAERIGDPSVDDMFDHIYGEIDPNLSAQKEYLKRSLEAKEIEEEDPVIKGGFP